MSSTSRNVVANYLGQAWTAVMGLAFIPLYIRHLGVEAYGLIGLFAVIQACLTLLDMGMTPTLNREMARFTSGAHTSQSIRDLLRTVEIICFSVAALMAAALWSASGYLATNWLRSENLPPSVVAQALGIMALVVALRFSEGIYRGALLGLQRQVMYNIAHAALATVRHCGAAAILVWLSPTIEAFFRWQAAISIVTVVIFALGVHRALPTSTSKARFSSDALTGIWKFASGVTAISALTLLLTQLDKVLLSRLLPLELFGYYTVAGAVAGSLYLIVGPITQAVYPRMVELSSRDDPADLIGVYHTGAQFVTVVTAPVVVLAGLCAGGVLFAWSGNLALAERVAPILSLLLLGTFLNGLMWMPYHCQLAYGWTTLALRINVVAVCTLVPALLWVVPRYGAIGAAWIWVALNAGYVLIAVQFMHRRLIPSEKWIWYRDDVLLPIAASLGVTLLATVFQPRDYQSRLEWTGFLMVTAGLALVASVLAADRIRDRVLRLAIGSIRRRNS